MSDDMSFSSYMSGTDALMHSFESDPRLRFSGCAVMLLEREPSFSDVRASFDRLSRSVRRFRQTVKEVPWSTSPPRFVDDVYFDLGYHVREMRVGGDGSVRALLDWVQVQQVQDLDKHRPPWEATLVSGLSDGRAAVVLKMSHATTDAVGALSLFAPLFDAVPNPQRTPLPAVSTPVAPRDRDMVRDANRREIAKAVPQVARAMLKGSASMVRDPVGSSTSAVRAARSLVRLMNGEGAASPLLAPRSLSVQCNRIERPLAELKSAAKAAHVTLNAAFVAAVGAGLRIYHEKHDAPVDTIQMGMPINVRNSRNTQKDAGNHWVMTKLPIPIRETDPITRMQQIKGLADDAMGEQGIQLFTPLNEVVSRLPSSLIRPLLRSSLMGGMDVGTSNVPGPLDPMWLAGAKIESLLFYGPIGPVASNITLLSYDGRVHVAVQSNNAAISDGGFYTECLGAGFDEVIAVGSG